MRERCVRESKGVLPKITSDARFSCAAEPYGKMYVMIARVFLSHARCVKYAPISKHEGVRHVAVVISHFYSLTLVRNHIKNIFLN